MTSKRTTADQILVRKHNTAIILDCLRLMAPLSRADISNKTGLNRSTVSSIINELIQQGLVRETVLFKSKLGRPGMALELAPDGACAIGAEIGVDFCSIMLANFVAQPIWHTRVAVDPNIGQAAFIQRAGDLIREVLDQARTRGLRPLGIGLGVPGLVDTEKGELKFAPNLKWHNVPLRGMLAPRFDVPIFVENDANAAALGEYYFGVAREVDNFIYLSADVGLGGGIVVGGKLFRGSGGFAGEVGHMAVNPDGQVCGCGRRGCWELAVGPRSVLRRIRSVLESGAESSIRQLAQGNFENVTFSQVIQAAEAGDTVALDALTDAARWLGIGIANLVNAFNPELIVLGGALALANRFLTPVVRDVVHEQALGPSQEVLKFAISAHRSEACVVGAVALVLEEILRYPLP